MKRNHERKLRGGTDILDITSALTDYDYSIRSERILDWGNYALTHLEMPDLGWGAGINSITELYLDHNALREFPLPIVELRNLKTLVLGSNELANISPGITTYIALYFGFI